MPKLPALEQKDFAKNSLIEAAGRTKVGNFLEVFEEEGGVATYLFENNQKGYVGWRWSITIYQARKSEPPTVSEVVLLPGPDSLVAPDWVPWSERLADYKALQLELEKQAALDAEETEEAEDAELQDVLDDGDLGDLDMVDGPNENAEDSVKGIEDQMPEAETEQQLELESAVTNLEEGGDSQDDSEKTGRKPPRFLLRRKGFKIKKARGKSKGPQD